MAFLVLRYLSSHSPGGRLLRAAPAMPMPFVPIDLTGTKI
jgi:hypothetical protein